MRQNTVRHEGHRNFHRVLEVGAREETAAQSFHRVDVPSSLLDGSDRFVKEEASVFVHLQQKRTREP